MSFALQYQKFIESEKSVGKNLIKPRNVYRINSYKYADGQQKTLTGLETALVFVLGITTDKKITCLKISLIKPDIFFKWLSKLFIKGLSKEKIVEIKELEEMLILGDRAGKKLFSSYLKGDPIYDKDPESYRTYNLNGIRNIEQITFKSETLLKYYK